MKKSVLITGANGYVGSNLINQYLKKGFLVYAIDKTKIDEKNNNDNYFFLKANIYNKKKIEKIFEKFYDIVIHLSGITRISDAKNNPIEAVKSNILGSTILFESYKKSCKKHAKKGTFIFISTAELTNIYLGCTSPSIYSITKSSSEEIIKNLFESESLNISIIRLCTVFGGAMENKSKVPRIFLEKIYKNEDIVVNQSNEKPSFMFIEDVVKIIFDLTKKTESHKSSNIKTFTLKGTEISLVNLVKNLQLVTNREFNYSLRRVKNTLSVDRNKFSYISKSNVKKFISDLKKSWRYINKIND